MLINYDTQKLDKLLEDFYLATGVEVSILKPDFTFAGGRRERRIPYCEAIQKARGETACLISDRELLEKCESSRHTEMSVCHAGLLNVAVPLFYEEAIIGYIIFGCIRTEQSCKATHLADYSSDERELIEGHYRSMPTFNDERISSVANIAIMLAKHILLENMLKPKFDESVEKAVEYIESNLTSELSIATIARKTNVSKSALYRGFHSAFGMTVSEYIRVKRIEYSVRLMRLGAYSVEELALRSGFAGASYYSRAFKKHMGTSPARYKREL